MWYFSVSLYKPYALARRNYRGVGPKAKSYFQEQEEPLLTNYSKGETMSHEDERSRLDQRINVVTNDSVDATRRIRAIAEETNQIGVDTLVTLNEQGEQLDNVERRLDEINVDLKQTDRNLTELEKCCGCCTCVCCAPKNFQKNKHYKKVYGKKANQAVVTNQPGSSDEPTTGGQGQGPFIKRVTDDDREDEMEDNLQ